MPDIRGLMSDPDFQRLPAQRQRILLSKTGASPEFIKEFQRLQIGQLGEENARKLAPAPEPAEREPYGVPGPGFRVNRLSMGPGRPHPYEAPAAVAGAALGTAPLAVGTGTVTGLVANEAVDRGARAMGAPPAVAETAGNVVGTLSGGGGGLLAMLARGGVKRGGGKILTDFLERLGKKKAKEVLSKGASKGAKETAEEAAEAALRSGKPKVPFSKAGGSKMERAWLESQGHVPRTISPGDVAAMKARGATQQEVEEALLRAARPPKTVFGQPMGSIPGSSPATGVVKEATQIANKIRTLKNTHKLSDPQVVASLKELYGMTGKEARQMLALVMGG